MLNPMQLRSGCIRMRYVVILWCRRLPPHPTHVPQVTTVQAWKSIQCKFNVSYVKCYVPHISYRHECFLRLGCDVLPTTGGVRDLGFIVDFSRGSSIPHCRGVEICKLFSLRMHPALPKYLSRLMPTHFGISVSYMAYLFVSDNILLENV